MQKYDNQHLLNNKINSWDQYYVIFTSMVSYVMFYICVWKHMCNQHYHVLNSKRFKEVNKKLKKIKKKQIKIGQCLLLKFPLKGLYTEK